MKKFFALLAVAVLVAFAAPAFAANPFVDVPMNHWSYDALSQLAAKGIIQGYPDGSFKGNQPMTRYEMATAVARALATVDMDKASKEDVEMLKRLVVEFKDELDALGIKVDELDERVAVLEENLGGWKFYGELRFTGEWADEEDQYRNVVGDTEFDLDRYRLWMTRKVDDKLTMIMRLGDTDSRGGVDDGMEWERYYAEVMFPWDFKVWIGKWNFDWEADDKIIYAQEAWFTDQTYKGFHAKKSWGNGYFAAFVAHSEDDVNTYDGVSLLGDFYVYGLRFNFNFNDRVRFALSGIMKDPDEDFSFPAGSTWAGNDMQNVQQSVYWADFTVNFTPGFSLIGAYYIEDLDDVPSAVRIPVRGDNRNDPATYTGTVTQTDDSPNAYKIVLNVDQSVLKFTSLWLEYANFDQGWQFFTFDDRYGTTPHSAYDYHFDYSGVYLPLTYYVGAFETDVFRGYLYQSWSDKWGSFISYTDVSYDGTDGGQIDTTHWAVGFDYWYTPSVKFTLSYEDADFDEDHSYQDDSLIRFRTWIFF
ncbi:MAG: S-layer homology domain-containing protein [Synergistales bacterium]|nr:S-layer homology domain-containing protein [Synergistales bacterium]